MIPFKIRHYGIWAPAAILIILFGVSSCSIFRTAAHFKKPTVTFQGIRIQNLTFETVDLVFNLAVYNPNSATFNITRYEYELLVNNAPFAKGDTKRKFTLPAEKTTSVDIPVSIKTEDLVNAYQALSTKDSTAYQAKLGVYFDIPVLKDKKIEVNRTGYMPLVKAPTLDVTALRLKELRLTGADLDMNVQLKNPNNFSLTLKRLTYEFLVSNKTWATGTMQREVPFGINSQNTFTVPIVVSFLQVGQSVYDVLANSQIIDYRFRGNILFNTSNPMIKEINFPFDRSGQTQAKK